MKKFLDVEGLKTLWAKVKEYVASAISGKADKTEVYTKTEVDEKVSSAGGSVDLSAYPTTESLKPTVDYVSYIKNSLQDSATHGGQDFSDPMYLVDAITGLQNRVGDLDGIENTGKQNEKDVFALKQKVETLENASSSGSEAEALTTDEINAILV